MLILSFISLPKTQKRVKIQAAFVLTYDK